MLAIWSSNAYVYFGPQSGHYEYAPDHFYQHGDDHEEYHAYPKYKFEYGVKDPHTGDHKAQWEERDGDVVRGAYELAEADGTKRIVEYTADSHNGFNAIVKKVGHAVHPYVYGEGHEHSPYINNGYYGYNYEY